MRAVFFDLDGTLVELPDDFAGLFEAALADQDVRADSERHEYYLEAFFGCLDECHEDPYRAAMADLRGKFGLAPSAEELAESYVRREAAATALRPGARELLDALAEDGTPASAVKAEDSTGPATALGVLTNGGARAQRRKLAYHDIADRFETVVVSGDVGASKPDAEIFAAARDAIPADEYVFIADDLERDVLPAQKAGFKGVHVPKSGEVEEPDGTPDADEAPDAGERAAATVESLREVPDLLA
jgi:HAD superfamily hydrolase (TIGR01549 family)